MRPRRPPKLTSSKYLKGQFERITDSVAWELSKRNFTTDIRGPLVNPTSHLKRSSPSSPVRRSNDVLRRSNSVIETAIRLEVGTRAAVSCPLYLSCSRLIWNVLPSRNARDVRENYIATACRAFAEASHCFCLRNLGNVDSATIDNN